MMGRPRSAPWWWLVGGRGRTWCVVLFYSISIKVVVVLSVENLQIWMTKYEEAENVVAEARLSGRCGWSGLGDYGEENLFDCDKDIQRFLLIQHHNPSLITVNYATNGVYLIHHGTNYCQ